MLDGREDELSLHRFEGAFNMPNRTQARKK